MGQPWGFYGEPGELGLPAPWLVMANRADARLAAAEQRELDQRRERAENRRDVALWQAMQLAWAEGRTFDPGQPETYVLTADQLGERVFAQQDREAARADRRAAVDAGLLHVLNVPATVMTPPTTPEPETAAQAARSRETSYMRLRVRRFFRDLADAKATHGQKVST